MTPEPALCAGRHRGKKALRNLQEAPPEGAPLPCRQEPPEPAPRGVWRPRQAPAREPSRLAVCGVIAPRSRPRSGNLIA